MDYTVNKEYSGLTDMYFAVWNGEKAPANYILVSFSERKLDCGVQPVAADLVEARLSGESEENQFVELISYSEDGTPVLNFDEPKSDENEVDNRKSIDEASLMKFLSIMEKIDILSWRNNFSSSREGLCWRIDIYTSEGFNKHIKGQARFPSEWSAFGLAMNELVESAK